MGADSGPFIPNSANKGAFPPLEHGKRRGIFAQINLMPLSILQVYAGNFHNIYLICSSSGLFQHIGTSKTPKYEGGDNSIVIEK